MITGRGSVGLTAPMPVQATSLRGCRRERRHTSVTRSMWSDTPSGPVRQDSRPAIMTIPTQENPER